MTARHASAALLQVAGLLFFCLDTSAQQYSFKYYGQQQGLKNLDINDLAQDHSGFIWVATQNGLYRYEGVQFRRFGTADGLSGAEVKSLHVAPNGTLWAGGSWGAAWFDGRGFQHLNVGQPLIIPGVNPFASNSSFTYIATAQGLFRVVANGTSFEAEQLSREPILAVTVDKSGTVWTACGGDDVCKLNGKSLEHVGRRMGLSEQRWQSMTTTTNGTVWARSSIHLFALAPDQSRFVESDSGLPGMTSLSGPLLADERLGVLVPTGKGLGFRRDEKWQVVGPQQGLGGEAVTCALRDREGSLWIGLDGAGLARWLGEASLESWTRADGLIAANVQAVRRGRDGTIWAASTDGLNLLRRGSHRWEKRLLESAVEGYQVEALAIDSKGNVWAGASPGGLTRFDSSGRRTGAFGARDGLRTDHIFGLVFDQSDCIWVTSAQGIFRSNPVTAPQPVRFEKQTVPGSNPGEWYFQPILDHLGGLWVPGALGLAHFSHGRWERLDTRAGLLQSAILAVAEDTVGNIWISYLDARGVTRIHPGDSVSQAINFDAESGLSSDRVYALTSTLDGSMWVGTDSGVDMLKRGRWRHFDQIDGLIWNDCSSNGLFADSDGSMWISTSRGLSHLRLNALQGGKLANPILTAVEAGHRNITAQAGSKLDYSHSSLGFEVADVNYRTEDARRFRYRLNNFDNQWQESTSNVARFSLLPPGRYVFEAQTWSAGFGWSGATQFAFSIAAPWWMTAPARAGYAVTIAMLVFLLVHLRTSRLMAQKKRLEQAVEERTRELHIALRSSQHAQVSSGDPATLLV